MSEKRSRVSIAGINLKVKKGYISSSSFLQLRNSANYIRKKLQLEKIKFMVENEEYLHPFHS